MEIPYEESLLHSRWINGILYWRECNKEEDHKLIQTTIKLLTTVAAIAVDNYTDPVAAMVSSMGTMLRLGYYLGKNGIDADAPVCSPEYLKKELVPLINPNCGCPACQAKIDFLKDQGITYEAPPERQGKSIIDSTPPDDFDVSRN